MIGQTNIKTDWKLHYVNGVVSLKERSQERGDLDELKQILDTVECKLCNFVAEKSFPTARNPILRHYCQEHFTDPLAEQAEKDAPTKIAETVPGLAAAQGLVGDKADDDMENLDDNVELSFAQEEQIQKDTIKKLKKERVIEGGIKLVREKSAFQWYTQLSDRLTLTQVTNFYVNKICCIAKEGLDPTRMEKDTLRMSTYLKLW